MGCSGGEGGAGIVPVIGSFEVRTKMFVSSCAFMLHSSPMVGSPQLPGGVEGGGPNVLHSDVDREPAARMSKGRDASSQLATDERGGHQEVEPAHAPVE
eukprot:568174-Pyramimonas_sp.AAC.1